MENNFEFCLKITFCNTIEKLERSCTEKHILNMQKKIKANE